MSDLIFHHCIPLNKLTFGEIVPHHTHTREKIRDEFDEFYVRTFQWWERRVGFYPLFFAVGKTEEDIRMTGYQNQFNRILESRMEKIGEGKKVTLPDGRTYNKGVFKRITKLRPAGDIDNRVLLSFRNVDGIFTDYNAWHMALNGAGNKGEWDATDREFRQIIKPCYNRARWLRLAKAKPHLVQLLAPKCDLRTAARVWVRNQDTKRAVEAMGFQNVKVKRLKSINYW